MLLAADSLKGGKNPSPGFEKGLLRQIHFFNVIGERSAPLKLSLPLRNNMYMKMRNEISVDRTVDLVGTGEF